MAEKNGTKWQKSKLSSPRPLLTRERMSIVSERINLGDLHEENPGGG
jgi:hypothetical protein